MPKVFICYRREDSAYPAHHIYGVLTNHYGVDSVVFDVDTIPIGADFREYLNNEVSRCDVLLAVIGDKWAEMLKQRIEDADDFVRIEIQAALERQIPVVPVLVGKASVPSAKKLPSEIERLAFKQAAEVRAGSDLQTHLDRLIRGLDRLFAIPKAEEEQRQEETEEAKRRAEETAKRKQAKQEAESARRTEAEREFEEVGERKAIPKTDKNTLGMEFVLIPAGSLTMGSNTGDGDEKPPHEVRISQSFYLQATEVTQGQWKKVMGGKPSSFKQCGDDCPVENVSWEDAQRFIEKLNQLEKTKAYRLPREAEWEYACRAGTTTEYSFGDDASKLGEFAWYSENSDTKTHPVGKKKPNAWGLYDMHGNVWEWVEDDSHESYDGAPVNGRAWVDDPRGSGRVIRGGGWISEARNCRSATRSDSWPDSRSGRVGFRLSRSVALGP